MNKRVKKNSVKKRVLLSKKDPTGTCNARTEQGYCQKQAGWETDHAGNGHCKIHGGFSTGRPKRDFVASEFVPSDILKKFEAITGEDATALTNVDNEINVARTIFYEYIEKCQKNKDVPAAYNVKQYIDALVKLIDKKHSIETKISKENTPIQVIVIAVNQLVKIINDCVHDEKVRKDISDRMRNIKILNTNGH